MDMTVRFSYTENIIPPRCRKVRPVRFDDGVTVIHVPEISAADAPIAIRATGTIGFEDDAPSFTTEYRFWNGSLWLPIYTDSAKPRSRISGEKVYDWPPLESTVDLVGDYNRENYEMRLGPVRYMTKADADATLQAQGAQHLLIDGVPYRPVGEPRYVVMTFGLGRNHGGTAVMIDDGYNSNIAKDCYFSLLERDKAIALATQIATDRGDTNNLPITPHGPMFEVLLPEAHQVKPQEQHGDGDPFLNSLQLMTRATGGAPIGGVLAMAMATTHK